jgi:hypothetical protein
VHLDRKPSQWHTICKSPEPVGLGVAPASSICLQHVPCSVFFPSGRPAVASNLLKSLIRCIRLCIRCITRRSHLQRTLPRPSAPCRTLPLVMDNNCRRGPSGRPLGARPRARHGCVALLLVLASCVWSAAGGNFSLICSVTGDRGSARREFAVAAVARLRGRTSTASRPAPGPGSRSHTKLLCLQRNRRRAFRPTAAYFSATPRHPAATNTTSP